MKARYGKTVRPVCAADGGKLFFGRLLRPDSDEAGEQNGAIRCGAGGAKGRGPRGMRTSKAHAGRRAGAACQRRWNAYGKCRTTDNRPYDKESFGANQGLTSDVFTMQFKSNRSITTPKKAQCRTRGSTVPESGTRRPAKAIVSSKSMGLASDISILPLPHPSSHRPFAASISICAVTGNPSDRFSDTTWKSGRMTSRD